MSAKKNIFKQGDRVMLCPDISKEKVGGVANHMSCDAATIIGGTFNVCKIDGSQIVLDVKSNKNGRLYQVGVSAKFFVHAAPQSSQ